MQKEDCNAVITLKNGKEYEGPKLPVSEDIPTRDEPIVEKNARNEKEYEKYEEVIMSKDKGVFPIICLSLQLCRDTKWGIRLYRFWKF